MQGTVTALLHFVISVHRQFAVDQWRICGFAIPFLEKQPRALQEEMPAYLGT